MFNQLKFYIMKKESKHNEEDGFCYTKNKFGVIQHIYDQCKEKTCLCSEGCRHDDLFFKNQYLYLAYKKNLKSKTDDQSE